MLETTMVVIQETMMMSVPQRKISLKHHQVADLNDSMKSSAKELINACIEV